MVKKKQEEEEKIGNVDRTGKRARKKFLRRKEEEISGDRRAQSLGKQTH